jgi:hypothetical protein
MAWLACCLVLIASGDDFNLLRVLATGAAPVSPADRLPLDDPNTDFTCPREGDASATPAAEPGVAPLPSPLVGAVRPDTPVARSCALPAVGVISHIPITTPLRC